MKIKCNSKVLLVRQNKISSQVMINKSILKEFQHIKVLFIIRFINKKNHFLKMYRKKKIQRAVY